MEIPFKHLQGAHCETATLASLLTHHGRPIAEPTVFGVGGGFFFAYLPFLRVTSRKFPLVSFRAPPGAIIKRIGKRLGVRFEDRTFKDPDRAMAELDALLDRGVPVALQTGVYWLPYLPGAFRFHFNAHNIIVHGRDGDRYRISDPVLAEPVWCAAEDLARARFSQGDMAPKGRMYHPIHVPKGGDLRPAMRAGLAQCCHQMLKIPFPLIGIRGMRRLSRVVRTWPAKLGDELAALNVGHLVLLLEEIGTGGAGFRFMFAGFLQESARDLELPDLANAGTRMTDIGDLWREFALLASRTCKGRTTVADPYGRLADILIECADREQAVLRDVSRTLEGGRNR